MNERINCISHVEKQLTQQDSLNKLMLPLYEQNPQAYYHCNMVANYGSWLAQLHGMNLSMQQKAYTCGLLHDIGKGNEWFVSYLSGIEGRTKEQLQIFNAHARYGYQILTDEMKPDHFNQDTELIDCAKFVTLYHHVGSLKAHKGVINSEKIRENFRNIPDTAWNEVDTLLMIVRIADELDSRTNDADIKIPPRYSKYFPQPMHTATSIMLDEFGEQNIPGKKYSMEFRPAFIELAIQMRQYSKTMGVLYK